LAILDVSILISELTFYCATAPMTPYQLKIFAMMQMKVHIRGV